MNRYQFHQAVHIAGKDFSRGIHEVSEKAEYDPTFLKYVGLGLITEADAKAKPPTPQSIMERNQALHDRLVKRADERKAAATAGKHPAPEEKPAPSAASESVSDEKADDEKSSKEKKSHTDKHKR
jgi:hypothetical protein